MYISLPSGCGSEQDAAQMLGYTGASWDNWSGQEQQPWSSIKHWSSLTANEQVAAAVLGYNETTWDDMSGLEPQPASSVKSWSELTSCTNGNHPHAETVV